MLIEDFRLVWRRPSARGRVTELLTSAPYPARDLQQNLADLRAQVAANASGAAELGASSRDFGLPVVGAYMRHVQDNAAEAVRRVIDRLPAPDGAPRRFRQELDDGARSSCAVDHRPRGPPRHRRLHRHGAAAGRQLQRPARGHDGRRALRLPHVGRRRHPAERRLPRAARHRHPAGQHALARAAPAAVAAGNVETSQAVTDALLGALGAAAAARAR